MQEFTTNHFYQKTLATGVSGKPTIPSGRQPMVERKLTDPSSAQPRGKGYPVPAYFENRVKFVESN